MAEEQVELSEENAVKRIRGSVLDNFTHLSDANESRRLKNAILLLRHLHNCEETENDNNEIKYALNRLVRGLGSSRASARTGFYSTLVALLSTLPSVTVSELRESIAKQLQIGGSYSKGEVGDIYLGQILACGALIRSGLYATATPKEQTTILEQLLSAGKKKSYLSMAASSFVVDLLEKVEDNQFEEVIWPVLKAEVVKEWTEQTLDSVYVLLLVQKRFPGRLKHSTLKKSLGTKTVFAEENVKPLCEVLLVNKEEFYMDMKSGAEAGWDFSSRWFFDNEGGNQGNLSNIETRRVVPVDLNAILCGSFRILDELYLELNDVERSLYWGEKWRAWHRAVQQVLWDEEAGVWFDFDAVLSRPRRFFYPSNVAPLWMRCFEKKPGLGKRVAQYLQDAGMMNYLGGLPTSLEQTGEQWDFPNAWPPLQEMVVQGLVNSEDPEAREMAQVLAARWVESNLMGYLQTGDMYEKYDAVNPGRRGGGGEYGVQKGFGWSNGVVLRFIYDFFRET